MKNGRKFFKLLLKIAMIYERKNTEFLCNREAKHFELKYEWLLLQWSARIYLFPNDKGRFFDRKHVSQISCILCCYFTKWSPILHLFNSNGGNYNPCMLVIFLLYIYVYIIWVYVCFWEINPIQNLFDDLDNACTETFFTTERSTM